MWSVGLFKIISANTSQHDLQLFAMHGEVNLAILDEI